MFTGELYFAVSSAEIPQTDFFSVKCECVVRDRTHDVRKIRHLLIKSGNDHLPVFIIRKRLPILDLCLHARAEIIVDRADHVDLVVADLVNVRQRILIYRVDERYRKLIPLFYPEAGIFCVCVSVPQDQIVSASLKYFSAPGWNGTEIPETAYSRSSSSPFACVEAISSLLSKIAFVRL